MDTKGAQLYISFTNLAAGEAGSRKRKTAASARRRAPGTASGFSASTAWWWRLGGYIRRASEAGAFTTEILLPLDGAQFVPEN